MRKRANEGRCSPTAEAAGAPPVPLPPGQPARRKAVRGALSGHFFSSDDACFFLRRSGTDGNRTSDTATEQSNGLTETGSGSYRGQPEA